MLTPRFERGTFSSRFRTGDDRDFEQLTRETSVFVGTRGLRSEPHQCQPGRTCASSASRCPRRVGPIYVPSGRGTDRDSPTTSSTRRPPRLRPAARCPPAWLSAFHIHNHMYVIFSGSSCGSGAPVELSVQHAVVFVSESIFITEPSGNQHSP